MSCYCKCLYLLKAFNKFTIKIIKNILNFFLYFYCIFYCNYIHALALKFIFHSHKNIANKLLNAYTHLYIVYVYVYKLTHLQLKLNFYKWLGKIYIPFWQLYIKIPDNIFKQTSEVKQTVTKTHKKMEN